jgi:hypothetical protein
MEPAFLTDISQNAQFPKQLFRLERKWILHRADQEEAGKWRGSLAESGTAQRARGLA